MTLYINDSDGKEQLSMDKLAEGKRVFDIEIEALKRTKDFIDETFLRILDLITNCSGKVIVTGIGKPGHIAAKLASTFASLGTPSFYLHPAEAEHGDLGMISTNDIVIAISYSGESDEIIKILPNIKLIGAVLVAITGNAASTLARAADVVQVLPKFDEACNLGLAPTASTTAVLCYGDALAVVASSVYGFQDTDYAKFHPSGALGKKLILKVDDLMSKGDNNAITHVNATLKDAIVELSKKGLGVVSIINDSNELIGVITDGDLRRQLERGVNVYELQVKDVMTKTPIVIESERMAVDALTILKKRNISCMPVLTDGKVVGTIRLQDIVGVGILG